MKNIVGQVDWMLRGYEAGTLGQRRRATLGQLTVMLVFCGLAYGGVMGSFGGFGGDRLWQVAFSAVKVPFLLLITFGLSLPSFFVLNTLFGVREDFAAVLRGLFLSQAGLTVILVALAPYTALWYISFQGYREAILFNGIMFGVASFAAQLMLRRTYRPLILRNPVHGWLLRLWLSLYAFVGIQMAWILRPFIGYPGMPVQFFRQDTWGNAYVIVGRMIWEILTRSVQVISGPG